MKLETRTPYHFTENGIKTIEEKYNAQYMGYWCTLRPSGGWNETPVDVFYVKNPDTSRGHTNYFGMFVRDDKTMITDASSCFSEAMIGVAENDTVYVSRYRHDYTVTPSGACIDGGRDYTKTSVVRPTAKDMLDIAEIVLSNTSRLVNVSVKNGEFEFSEILLPDEQR